MLPMTLWSKTFSFSPNGRNINNVREQSSEEKEVEKRGK
jgi:hypothetical protein